MVGRTKKIRVRLDLKEDDYKFVEQVAFHMKCTVQEVIRKMIMFHNIAMRMPMMTALKPLGMLKYEAEHGNNS